MKSYPLIFTVIFSLVALAFPAMAQSGGTFPERVIGEGRTPVVIDEYISLTCPHCAEFYLNTLPEIEKRFVKTGKVRIIVHDFPLDGASLKAASLARCMSGDEFFPFIQLLYENQSRWATSPNPEKVLVQYAKLGGLDDQRARECINDPAIQNAVIAERDYATQQYGVSSTPTFVFNKGVEKMEGASGIDGFTTIINRMLARATH